MKEKIKLLEKDEPRLYKSLIRIAEYYVRASRYINRLLKENTEEIIYKKETTNLPEKFKKKNDFLVLKVGTYNLESLPLKDIYKNVYVECHINGVGKVLDVYMDEYTSPLF